MKKLPEQLKTELESLKSINIDNSWKEQTKIQLSESLGFGSSYVTPTHTQVGFSVFHNFLRQFAFKPVGVLLIVIATIVGPGLATVKASQGSLPGDALYPVKIGAENLQINLALSTKRKVELEISRVSNRVHELKRLTIEKAPSIQREEQIALAVAELQKSTEVVKTRIEEAKVSETTTDITKIIEDSDYQETITVLEDFVDESNILEEGEHSNIDKAVNDVQEVTLKVLNVLVDESNGNSEEQDDSELIEKIEKQLVTTEKLLDSTSNRVSLLLTRIDESLTDQLKKEKSMLIELTEDFDHAKALFKEFGDTVNVLSILTDINEQVDIIIANVDQLALESKELSAEKEQSEEEVNNEEQEEITEENEEESKETEEKIDDNTEPEEAGAQSANTETVEEELSPIDQE